MTAMLQRSFEAQIRAVDDDTNAVELSFSSELPYERWFGIEILSHAPGHVRMDRLNRGVAVLLDHTPARHAGTTKKAWIEDRRGRAVTRYGSHALGQETLLLVREGIKPDVSVGYLIHSMLQIRRDASGNVVEQRAVPTELLQRYLDRSASFTRSDRAKFVRDLARHFGEAERAETPEFLVDDWEPFEISHVAVPADFTVGVGRAAGERTPVPQAKEPSVDDLDTRQQPAAPTPPAQPVNIQAIESAAQAAERERSRGINALGEQHGMADLARAAVDNGTSLDAFRQTVLDKLQEARKLRPAESAEIGMSRSDLAKFSVRKLMLALAYGHQDRSLIEAAAFEIDASNAARKLRPIEDTMPSAKERSGGYTIPVDVLRAPMVTSNAQDAARQALAQMLRDLTVGTPTAGGNLVATDLLSSDFITLLRNRLVLGSMGARVMTDLNGNIAIPSQTGGASTFWVTEGNPVTESQATFGQVAMTPKTVGMFTDYSRRLLLQSSIDIEMLVRMDLVNGIAVEVDRVGIAGSGSGGQPTGVLNTAGIGAVVGGTNGAAPTLDHIVDLESAVANVNADVGSLGYVTNTKVRGKLKKTQQFTGTNGVPLWTGNELNGYRAGVTNNVPSNLTKGTSSGVCSAIAYGNWSDLLIGLWSGIDLILDPYTGATAGTRRVVALQDLDIAIRRAASFSAMADALTT